MKTIGLLGGMSWESTVTYYTRINELVNEILGKDAQGLEQAGADFLLICTNTMHKVAPQIAEYVSIPILHIADATIAELQAKKIKKVALLGTKYTMTQNFYKQKIIESGIDVWIPNDADIETVNQIIFAELCHGKILAESKEAFIEVINQAIEAGAEGVILGCTEIGLLIQQEDVAIPVFDTTEIHSQKAVELALAD